MYKLLVLTCLLASSLADPFGIQSWLREAGRRPRQARGCSERSEGRRACARLGDALALAPHSGDCSVFFYCRGGGARPACRRCPAGLLFHSQLQVCDWPANVQCTPRPPHDHDTTPNPDDDASVTVTTPDKSNVDRSTSEASPSSSETTPYYSWPWSWWRR